MTYYSIVYYDITLRGEKINVGAFVWDDTKRRFIESGMDERLASFISGYIPETTLMEAIRQLRLVYFDLPYNLYSVSNFVKRYSDPFNGLGMTEPRASTMTIDDLADYLRKEMV